MKAYTIQENDAGQRLDKFIAKAVPLLPKGLLYKGIRTKRIKINGKRCDAGQKLLTGDQIELYLNDEFFEHDTQLLFLSAPSNPHILYEDDYILLCDKPAGLVVHEDNRGTSDTLIHRIQHYLYDKGVYRPQDELSFAPALCNRIDRNTGGIVIAAKNAESLRILNEKIRNHELHKKYLCILVGYIEPPQGTLIHYMRKDERNNTVDVFDRPGNGLRTMVSHYQTIARRHGLTLAEVALETGRTHQIRAQFAHAGHPLLGDGKYGNGEINRRMGLKRQALYSYSVAFHFRSDAGILQYLDGQEFTVPDVWFTEMFKDDSPDSIAKIK